MDEVCPSKGKSDVNITPWKNAIKIINEDELRASTLANIDALKKRITQHKAKLRRCKRDGIRCKDKTMLLRKELDEERAKLDRLTHTDTHLYYEGSV